LKERYRGIGIRDIYIEQKQTPGAPLVEADGVKVRANVQIDLGIVLKNGKHAIIDHKTGVGADGQLEFYAEILFPDDPNVEKLIFQAWEGTLGEEKKYDTAGGIRETIREFLESEEIAMPERNKNGNYTECKSCLYPLFCNRG